MHTPSMPVDIYVGPLYCATIALGGYSSHSGKIHYIQDGNLCLYMWHHLQQTLANLYSSPRHSFHPLTSSQFCFRPSRVTHRSHPQLIHIGPHISCLHIKRGSLTLQFLSFLKEAVECDGKRDNGDS